MTFINLRSAKKWLVKKSLPDFIREFWDAYEIAPFSDCWLTEWQSECFMYSVKHFLPKYVWNEWISDEQYERIKLETYGTCPVRDKMFNGKHVHNHDWNMPPRHSKTSILGVCGPVWLTLNSPVSIATVSHTARLSGETNEKRLKLLQSDKFHYYFHEEPQLKLAKQSATNIQLVNGAQMYAVCQISFTGFGADVIIADDLISADNAAKDMQMLKNVREFYRQTLPTRLNTKETGVIWQIQQRLARGDISGMIAEDPDLRKVYSHTELQAIAEKDHVLIYPCSGKIQEIHKGDFLWEKRFGDYTTLRMETGKTKFNIQYQQRVEDSDLNVIHETDIHYIEEDEFNQFKNTAESVYASHDCPVKDSESNDFHGFVHGYGRGNELVIDDGWEEHLGYIKEKQLMINQQKVCPSLLQIVEDKANGAALLQDLRLDVKGLIAFEPGTNSKKQRLELASVYIQNGAVRFVKSPKTEYLIKKLLDFPFIDHDDIIDACSQLILYHFTQRTAGVYTNCFTYENVVREEYDKNVNVANDIYACTINADLIKMLRINVQEDKFIVLEEWQLRGIEQFESFFLEKFQILPIMLDCSYENTLYKLIKNPSIVILPFNDSNRDESIHSLKVGFYKKKVLVKNTCSQTINDISKLRLTDSSIEQGKQIVNTYDEGLAGCVRGVITYYKGLDIVW